MFPVSLLLGREIPCTHRLVIRSLFFAVCLPDGVHYGKNGLPKGTSLVAIDLDLWSLNHIPVKCAFCWKRLPSVDSEYTNCQAGDSNRFENMRTVYAEMGLLEPGPWYPTLELFNLARPIAVDCFEPEHPKMVAEMTKIINLARAESIVKNGSKCRSFRGAPSGLAGRGPLWKLKRCCRCRPGHESQCASTDIRLHDLEQFGGIDWKDDGNLRPSSNGGLRR
jgi:hypothetical protein